MPLHTFRLLCPTAAALCLLSVLAACPEEGEPTPGDNARCIVDDALVAAGGDCVTDEHCPCGTHCNLGACTSVCTDDDDCGGGRCDDFGRCRVRGAQGLVPVPTLAQASLLTVSPSRLTFQEAAVARIIDIVTGARPSGTIRVLAPAGFSVACGDTTFAAECRFGAAQAMTSRPLRVVLNDDAPEGAAGTARIFHGPDRYTVGLESELARADSPAAGVYAGFAKVIGMGLSAADETVAQIQSSRVHPLTAELHVGADDGPGVLVIRDVGRALHPEGELIGSVQISSADGGGEVQWPAFEMYAGVALAGLPTSVVAQPTTNAVSLRGVVPTLSFPLTYTYRGISEHGVEPKVVYSIVLSRIGDLDTDAIAPAVPADVALPELVQNEQSAWELAVAETLAPSDTLAPGEAAAFFGVGSVSNLNLCGAEQSAAAISGAAEDYFSTDLSPGVASPELAQSTSRALVRAVTDAFEGTSAAFRPIAQFSTTFTSPSSFGTFPCQIAPKPFNTCGAVGLDAGSINVCEEIAQAYGCTIERFDPEEGAGTNATLSILIEQENGQGPCNPNFLAPVNVPTEVQRVCVFQEPVAPASCTQLSMCFEPPEALGQAPMESHVSTQASLLSSDVDTAGDLRCVTGERSAGMVDAQQTGGLFDVLTACLSDLEAARSAIVITPARKNASGVAALFDTAGCLDAARFAFTLSHATAPTRRADGAPSAASDDAALAIAHRLLQSWLTLHGLVARESIELDPLLSVLQLENDIDPAVAFELSVNGWALVFHPRYYSAIEALPDALIYAPDYRPLIATSAAAFPNADAQVGLAAFMVEALDAQAQLLHVLLKRRHREGELGKSQNVLDDLAAFRRTETIVRALASGLLDRALQYAEDTEAPPPAWLDRYITSARAYRGTMRGVEQAADDINQGRNPLGIEDADLPLYFFGDEASATSRFTALSDFLLGAPGSPTAWGPRAVEDADNALVGARTAGISLQTRQFEQSLSGAEQGARLDDIRRSFGDTVINYCGLPAGLDPLDVLDDWPRVFNTENCFMNRADPECVVPVEAYEKAMSLDDVQYQFCVVRELRAVTAGGIGFLDPAYDGVSEELETCPHLEYPAPCPEGSAGPCVKCDWTVKTTELITLNALDALTRSAGIFGESVYNGENIADNVENFCNDNPTHSLCICKASFDNVGGFEDRDAICASAPVPPNTFTFSALPGLAQTPADFLAEAKTRCQARYPGARESLPGPNDLVGEPPTDRSCFNGSLGEMALGLESVSTDMDIARAEMAELHDAYDVAIRSCLIQQSGNELLDATLDAHNRTMGSLREQKLEADKASVRAEAVEDCASAAASVTSPFSLAAGAVACGASAVQADADITSLKMEAKMAEAEAGHAALMQRIEGEIEEQLCFNDAELHLVGVRTASLRVQRAAQDMGTTLYQFEQAKSSAQTAYDAGRAALVIAGGRFVRPPSHDYWFDESVDTYHARMRIARRLVYLATRAVEYEFQASLSARATVLAADIPGDLEGAVAELRSISATRGIAGSRPADLKLVLSLRKQIMQVGNLSLTQQDGWHRLTDVQRFRMLLQSQKYAAYDDEGSYIGQQVPFSLAPLGALDLGEAGGVPIFASNDCAERLWDVNASVVGTGLYRGDAPSFVRVDLLKSNTFYSQWCGDNDEPFQTASVRPSRNLFREPADAIRFGELASASNETSEMSRARIQAHINIGRAEFERDEFSSGSTSELAARGLYGEYALFIPAGVLSNDSDEDGLALNLIDDILLRLDYVSVAK